ncbi:MAG: hypothetical protein R6V59_01820 [Dehalococcoidia bacterium]
MDIIKNILNPVTDEEMEKLKRTSKVSARIVANKGMHSEPAAHIAIEDFYIGPPTDRVGFWHDEIHIILKGKAEVTSQGFPTFEKQVVTVEKGDCCIIHRGEQVNWSTIEEPVRKICIVMPRQEISAASIYGPQVGQAKTQ